MELLVWNNEMYLYDFRIVRYLSLLCAVLFSAFFLLMIGVELDLVFVNGSEDNLIDLMSALFLGYNLALHTPTLLVSVIIVAKELTLNQLAWRRDQDYAEGKLYNTVDMDFFDWFGISEDPDLYLRWLKKWGKEFL